MHKVDASARTGNIVEHGLSFRELNHEPVFRDVVADIHRRESTRDFEWRNSCESEVMLARELGGSGSRLFSETRF